MKFHLGVILFLFSTLVVHATSGACSYHGGVNCSAGADYDGSVICNDGTRDSSVSYASMTECQLGKCTSPYLRGETDSSVCSGYRHVCNLNYQGQLATLVGNGSAQYAPSSLTPLSSSCPQADECDREVVANTAAQTAYQQCKSTQTALLQDAVKHVLHVCGAGEVFDETQDKCVSAIDICIKLAGNMNVYAKDGKCYCSNGYVYDKVSSVCVSVAEEVVAEQITVPATTSEQVATTTVVVKKVALIKKPPKKNHSVTVRQATTTVSTTTQIVTVEDVPKQVWYKALLQRLRFW